MNTFVKSQFNYTPLVWMCCSRNANNMINTIRQCALQTTSDNQTSNFTELLVLNNDMKTHGKNFQFLMTENLKKCNGLAPPITTDFVTTEDIIYNLRNPRESLGNHQMNYANCDIWPTINII